MYEYGNESSDHRLATTDGSITLMLPLTKLSTVRILPSLTVQLKKATVLILHYSKFSCNEIAYWYDLLIPSNKSEY